MRTFRRAVGLPRGGARLATGALMSRYRFSGLVAIALLAIAARVSAQPAAAAPQRPVIGVAFGGGSARGLAHVGVIRWFEEHHIPIDLVAGTSMGGLIGGAFASGHVGRRAGALLASTDWDEMFGSSPFRYKNVRRKQDARAYPVADRVRPQAGHRAAAGAQQRAAGGLPARAHRRRLRQLPSFDELPTPFRCGRRRPASGAGRRARPRRRWRRRCGPRCRCPASFHQWRSTARCWWTAGR